MLYCNTDGHLKNHNFVYYELNDVWNLSTGYDVTYSLNPLINFSKVARALSINNKRVDIALIDVLTIAEMYSIKKATKIIIEVQETASNWQDIAHRL